MKIRQISLAVAAFGLLFATVAQAEDAKPMEGKMGHHHPAVVMHRHHNPHPMMRHHHHHPHHPMHPMHPAH